MATKKDDSAAVEKAFPGAVEVSEDVHPLVRIITESPFYAAEVDGFAMAMQLLDAPDADALLTIDTDGELTHAEDVLGKPFMLEGVRFNPGDKNPAWPLYAVMDVTWNGEKDVMSCGGLNVCVAAYKMATEGWLPRMVKIVEREKATRAGFHPLNLLAATDEDVEKARAAAAASKGF